MEIEEINARIAVFTAQKELFKKQHILKEMELDKIIADLEFSKNGTVPTA